VSDATVSMILSCHDCGFSYYAPKLCSTSTLNYLNACVVYLCAYDDVDDDDDDDNNNNAVDYDNVDDDDDDDNNNDGDNDD